MTGPREVRGNRIVWKLSAAFLAITLLVLLITGYFNHLVDKRYTLSSARENSMFYSDVIRQSLRKLMMMRDNDGIRELILGLADANPLFEDIRLVSHDGEVVVSRRDEGTVVVKEASRPCNICHDAEVPSGMLKGESFDEVVEGPGGNQLVSVITPILNETDCRTAECHAHAESPPVLGVLQTDLRLTRLRALLSLRSLQSYLAVIAAVLLCILTTLFMVDRLLERPIRTLIDGMKRIAGRDFSFRFKLDRNDEIGLLADSFNDMAARLETSHVELSHTTDYLQGIVENSADIIITVNPSGFIETFNRGAEAALGYQRAEVIGRRIEMLFADPNERAIAIERLRNTDNVVNYETHFLTKTGEVRDVILTLSRLRDRNGRSIGTFGISKDVTRENELRRRILQSERFAAIGQAFTGILHTLKNMLNALTGGAYMVRTAIAVDDKETLKEGWEIVQGGINSVREMSMNMLQYVREMRPEYASCDLGQLIREIANVMKHTAEEKGVRISTHISQATPEIRCDSKLLHSAIMDIVSNALDACLMKEYEEGGRGAIAISLFPFEGGKVAIEVRDNGIGMTEDVQANVFTPFFSTKKRGGTGLGLALTLRAISVHGGSISVESEPGEGSAFRIVLPVDSTE